MFSTTYGLNYNPDDFSAKAGPADAGAGVGLYSLSLGSAYADTFKRDRAPTQLELLSHLVGTAYRCASLNANLVASTRLRLYLRTAKGEPKAKFVEWNELRGRKVTKRIPARRLKAWRCTGSATKSALLDAVQDSHDGDVEEVTEHPILDLLRNPEDALTDGGLTSFAFRKATQMQLESMGRSYWYVREWQNIPGAGKVPKRFALLRSQLVMEKVDASGKGYIDYYQYGTQKLATTEVIRLVFVDPGNPHLGFLSPMRAAIEKIRLARGGDAFVNALLQNGGFPLGLISPKDETGVIGDRAAARLQSSIRSASSMDNVGKIMVIGSAAVQLQTLAWKPAEVIDVERAREIEGQIAACFDVPRTKLFLDTSAKTSGETGEAAHARDAGLPRCTDLEESLNAQLVPLFDDSGRLFLAFDSPVPEDALRQLEETRTGGQLGLQDIDEGRASLGLEPLDTDIGKCRILPKGSVLLKPDGSVIDTGGDEPDDDEPATEPKPKPKKPKKGSVLRLLARQAARQDRQMQRMVELLAQQKGSHEETSQAVQRGTPGGAFVDTASKEAAIGGSIRADHDASNGSEHRDSDLRVAMKSRLLAEGYTEAEIDAMQPAPVSTATL